MVIFVWASIRHRRSQGKPIAFRDVPGAQFIDKRASGHSHRTWFTRLGGARNCLIVAVKDRRLIIRPFFPFNMMFLPEIYGMEYDVALGQITSVERGSGSRVHLRFRDGDGSEQNVTVFVRDRDRFLAVLRQ